MEIQSLTGQGSYTSPAGLTERENARSEDASHGDPAPASREATAARRLGAAANAYSASGRAVEETPERTGISVLA